MQLVNSWRRVFCASMYALFCGQSVQLYQRCSLVLPVGCMCFAGYRGPPAAWKGRRALSRNCRHRRPPKDSERLLALPSAAGLAAGCCGVTRSSNTQESHTAHPSASGLHAREVSFTLCFHPFQPPIGELSQSRCCLSLRTRQDRTTRIDNKPKHCIRRD